MSQQAVIKPRGLSFADAASLPLAGLTALQTFTKHAAQPVGPGSKVLVLGGSGGVGSAAIQIAKALGAETVAATSSDTALLTRLGADVAINYREEDWSEKLAGQDYDCIFATVADGDDGAERALKVLAPKGSFIYTLDKSALKDPNNEAKGDRKFAFMLTDSKDAQSLVRIANWASEGKVKAVLDNDGKAFPFNQEGWEKLMKRSNSGRTKGKLVMDLA
jgi:NADPH:quinone reductase-like Zn-dependent oxidoreductase